MSVDAPGRIQNCNSSYVIDDGHAGDATFADRVRGTPVAQKRFMHVDTLLSLRRIFLVILVVCLLPLAMSYITAYIRVVRDSSRQLEATKVATPSAAIPPIPTSTDIAR